MSARRGVLGGAGQIRTFVDTKALNSRRRPGHIPPRLWRPRPSFNTWLMAALLVLIPSLAAHAQTSTIQFLPEVDAHLKLQSNIRFVFQAKDTREGGNPTEAEVGPSIDFYLKPLVKLRETSAFELDDAKSRPLVLSIGYRYVPSPGKAPVDRMEPVVIFHFPTKGRILVSDRNRAVLVWSTSRNFTWRYRNRLTLEQRATLPSYHPLPYSTPHSFSHIPYTTMITT